MSLFWRVFLINAAVLLTAGVVLASTPGQLSWPDSIREAVTLAAAAALTLGVTLLTLRRVFAPLEQLRTAMRAAEPLEDARRIPIYGDHAEVVELTRTFNEMLKRLEAERQDSVRQALAAQEAERARIARELHDEVGQSLTAVLLQLERAARDVPDEVRDGLVEAREATRATLEEVRGIARRLRPEALDELGLPSALAALAERISTRTGVEIRRRLERTLPELGSDSELVVYRVAQEALTNAVRHSGSSEVTLTLEAGPEWVRLLVTDDGRGLGGAPMGSGREGMRERALLVGAELAVTDRPSGGTEVRLELGAQA